MTPCQRFSTVYRTRTRSTRITIIRYEHRIPERTEKSIKPKTSGTLPPLKHYPVPIRCLYHSPPAVYLFPNSVNVLAFNHFIIVNQSVSQSFNQLVSTGISKNVYIGKGIVDISVSSGVYAIFHQPSFARLCSLLS